ncbi:tripartite tricarboxylate transporter substrate binding protein [Bradyrhizobium sp. URHD0069]|jgi:tripartite-type tricarboxylate transporter receptor subunit TctC|uniref:Bug family tripartite tricarboxylate transporter substrate binding protein n=1 Tax=Bradyrhizobium sp. URHD0069 TaxID=1380355 RepID=UPI000A8ECFB5|nr:tripartite tricarboxylate transporter substrate binding protein [Bradyrhizobium sp. URHD0069]
MLRPRMVLKVAVLIAGVCGPVSAMAETFPSRPITFIVPWGAGGGADQLARIVSKLVEPELKVSVPIINMPGATGQTGHTKLVTSPADGYTVEVMTGDTFALFIAKNARFKLDQITPLAVMIQQPSGFFANATGSLQTWDDVQKIVGDKELRMAVTGYGSPDDMSVNYFKNKAMKFQSVSFAEPGMRYASVVGGQSDLIYEQAGDIRSFIDGKQIKPVLFFSKKPVEGFEDVPYSGKLGYNVFLPQFRVIVARAGTDPAIVKTLSAALAKAADTNEFRDYLKLQYAEKNSFIGPAESLKFMKDWLAEASQLSQANSDAALVK